MSASNIIEERGDERSGQEGREGMNLGVPDSTMYRSSLCHTYETALNQHCLPMRKLYFHRPRLFRNENLNVCERNVGY